jgi:hypothetical protein
MQRRFFNIILFFVVGAIGIPNLSQAQEGEVIEEKSENSETIPQDSLPLLSESPEDGSHDNSDILPVGPMPDFNLSKAPLVEPNYDKDEKKNNIGTNDKLKNEEPQSNHSFNFIYYLFYKFKLADSTDG